MEYWLIVDAEYLTNVHAADTTVEGGSPRLQERVNEAIAQGWRPQGGVAVAIWETRRHNMPYYNLREYAQAMVRGPAPGA